MRSLARWSIEVDASTFIAIAIAVGLSTDFLVHIAYHFDRSQAPSVVLALTDSLKTIGLSMSKGAASTLFGVVVMSASNNATFQIIFKMIFTTVLTAFLAGILLYPALRMILSFITSSDSAPTEAMLPASTDPGTAKLAISIEEKSIRIGLALDEQPQNEKDAHGSKPATTFPERVDCCSMAAY